jgi:hypothetical protein
MKEGHKIKNNDFYVEPYFNKENNSALLTCILHARNVNNGF